MTKASLSVAGVFATVALAGCAGNPVNARTAERYSAAGLRAELDGNLALARENYARAHANVVLGNLGPAREATALYELTRVTGYLGQYDEAEQGFLRVFELIDEADGGADGLEAPAYSEYARMLHDTGQHARAVPVFERAVRALEAARILDLDPLGFASFLEDYARSLENAGLAKRSGDVARRIDQLRAANPDSKPAFEPRRYRS